MDKGGGGLSLEESGVYGRKEGREEGKEKRESEYEKGNNIRLCT